MTDYDNYDPAELLSRCAGSAARFKDCNPTPAIQPSFCTQPCEDVGKVCCTLTESWLKTRVHDVVRLTRMGMPVVWRTY